MGRSPAAIPSYPMEAVQSCPCHSASLVSENIKNLISSLRSVSHMHGLCKLMDFLDGQLMGKYQKMDRLLRYRASSKGFKLHLSCMRYHFNGRLSWMCTNITLHDAISFFRAMFSACPGYKYTDISCW